jgi:hypothetical protein
MGSYEAAVKWFGIYYNTNNTYTEEEQEQKNKKIVKGLVNIINYYQTSPYTTRRFSNELKDILVSVQSNRKYFCQFQYREQNAQDAIEMASKLGLIFDDKLLRSLENRKLPDGTLPNNIQKRIYLFKRS